MFLYRNKTFWVVFKAWKIIFAIYKSISKERNKILKKNFERFRGNKLSRKGAKNAKARKFLTLK